MEDDFICKIDRHRHTTQGEKWRGDTLRDWDCHAYTVDTMYKIDT